MGFEALASLPIDGKIAAFTALLTDYKCVSDGDKGSNIGGTGMAVLNFHHMVETVKERVEKTPSFIAKVTNNENRIPKGRSHPGSTSILKGFKATEHNRCPGDFEI